MNNPEAPAGAAATGRPDRVDRLVVIDMQEIFSDRSSPWATPRFDEALTVVRKLTDHFGEHTIYTRFVAPEKPEGAWIGYYDEWPFALQSPDAHAYQIVDGLEVAGRPCVDATTFGKWTDEMRELVAPGDHMVLCGVSTDCCVLATAVAAADAGVWVTVVADGCAGVDDTSQAQALAVMALYGPLVTVVSSADILPG